MLYPNIRQDRSELVSYDKTDYPAYIRKGFLSYYPNYSAESHWHDDIEFIFIVSGQMQYNINGEVVTLERGNGIFINSKQLHFGYSEGKKECVFYCILLHPIMLCSSQSMAQKYVNPLISNENIPFYHFKGNSEWERNILSSIREIYEFRDDPLSQLKIQRAFIDIWIKLCENLMFIKKEHIQKNHRLSALKNMITFIDLHYSEKLTLYDIAKSGNVGKTGCCNIFKQYINKTPNEYLTELRLRKAVELLKDTDMTILEISYEVGFSGASYFSETFKKYYDCTPKEYRIL